MGGRIIIKKSTVYLIGNQRKDYQIISLWFQNELYIFLEESSKHCLMKMNYISKIEHYEKNGVKLLKAWYLVRSDKNETKSSLCDVINRKLISMNITSVESFIFHCAIHNFSKLSATYRPSYKAPVLDEQCIIDTAGETRKNS